MTITNTRNSLISQLNQRRFPRGGRFPLLLRGTGAFSSTSSSKSSLSKSSSSLRRPRRVALRGGLGCFPLRPMGSRSFPDIGFILQALRWLRRYSSGFYLFRMAEPSEIDPAGSTLRGIFFGAPCGQGAGRIVGPEMSGIAPFHLFLHLRIRAAPEGGQVAGNLQRTLRGR